MPMQPRLWLPPQHIKVILEEKRPPQSGGEMYELQPELNTAKNVAATKVVATRATTGLTTTNGGATNTQVVGEVHVVKWNMIFVFFILHSHTLACQRLGLQFHFVDTNVFWVFCLEFTKQGKQIAIYRLTTYCALGLDCHEVGVTFMNTCSLSLRFYPKPPLVTHDSIVIPNPKFADF